LREVDWWWCKSKRHARSMAQAKVCLLIAVDVLVANLWMVLLYGAQKSDKIDKWLKADNVL
jgi:hypothetical protein